MPHHHITYYKTDTETLIQF